MNPVAATSDLPIRTLLGGRVQQPGKPRQGHGDGTSVEQANAERVLIEAHVTNSFTGPHGLIHVAEQHIDVVAGLL
jgi:hypothetical protein